MNDYDALIIGGGAAGLSAALVLLRARRRGAVIDAGQPRNAPASHMHGFLSREGVPPADFLAAGRAEVIAYGGAIIHDTVVALTPGFVAELSDGTSVRGRRVLVTTGLRDRIPLLPGLSERWGRDVLHCRTATATKCAISPSVSSAAMRTRSPTPSSSGSGRTT